MAVMACDTICAGLFLSCFPHLTGKIKIVPLLRIGGIINMCLRQECLHVLPFVLGCFSHLLFSSRDREDKNKSSSET